MTVKITSYGTLKTAIAAEMNRSDLTDHMPGFVQRAEEFFNRDLHHQKNLYRYPSFPLTAEYTTWPTDVIEMVAIEIPINGVTQRIEIEPVTGGLNLRGSVAGTSIAYSIANDSIRLSPPPTGSLTADLIYYRGVTSIIGHADGESATNWLLTSHSGAYLYRALMEAAMFRRDAARLQDYERAFEGIWSSISKHGRNQLRAANMRVRLGV